MLALCDGFSHCNEVMASVCWAELHTGHTEMICYITASVYCNQDFPTSVLQMFLITKYFWQEEILTEPYTKTNYLAEQSFLCGRHLTVKKINKAGSCSLAPSLSQQATKIWRKGNKHLRFLQSLHVCLRLASV
jgi:hypothetical protein